MSVSTHWLLRPRTIRRLKIGFGAALALTVLAEVALPPRPSVGFFAWYGFASCIVLVLLAKGVGRVVKREDTYYERD